MAWDGARIQVWKKMPRTRVISDWATKPANEPAEPLVHDVEYG